MTFFERLQRETAAERNALYAVPLVADALKGAVARESYIAYLTEAYHHVRHTTPLLMTAGGRLTQEQNAIRKAFAEYIEEEIGHEEWILNDIAACGADKEAARHSCPNRATELMVAYAYDSVTRGNPVSFLGMVFVLEGTSTSLATHAAEVMMESLGLKRNCFSYLLSHGALDIEHMKFFEKLVNTIDSKEDQQAIIHMAKIMFGLFADMFRSIPHAAQEMAA